MQVLGSDEGESQSVGRDRPIFEGGDVWMRPLAGPGASNDVSCNLVQFSPGARTKWHTHTSDQMLYVVSGIGQVGDRQTQRTISAGDFALIPSGEEHWHGAGDTGSPMSHLAITGADSETAVLEE